MCVCVFFPHLTAKIYTYIAGRGWKGILVNWVLAEKFLKRWFSRNLNRKGNLAVKLREKGDSSNPLILLCSKSSSYMFTTDCENTMAFMRKNLHSQL